MNVDKLKGMLVGVALGDALGLPHEQRYATPIYTGKLQYETKVFNRFRGETIYPIGSVSDDTEMTLALARQIGRDQGYNEHNVILAYQQFASNCPMLGNNTRELFKGISTVKGYQKRYQKKFGSTVTSESWTQSNGSLMRCSPLVVFKEYQELLCDTALTNPHPVNLECGLIYLSLLKQLINDSSLPPLETILSKCKQPDVQQVIADVKNKIIRDVKQKELKGWVCTTLYCALYSIYYFEQFELALEFVITQKGDTDTNASVTAALFGAKHGFEQLAKEQQDNIDRVIQINHSLADLDLISNNLYNVYLKQ